MRSGDSTPETNSNESSVEDKLDYQKWYHGIQTADEVEALLRYEGQFLVRAEETKNLDYFLFLTIKLNNNRDPKKSIRHLQIKREKRGYRIGTDRKFVTIVEMIFYYMRIGMPNGIRLREGIDRPRWLIHHKQIKYDAKLSKLGSGNFSVVYHGKYLYQTREETVERVVAIKVCKTKHFTAHETASMRKKMMQEAKFMLNYKNDYIIRFYGVACDIPPVMLLLEYCIGGSLESFLEAKGSNADASEKQMYLLDTARGMRYLHKHKCIHRDIASRNCLISKDGLIKISDFGMSRLLKGTCVKDDQDIVPLRWIAPECINIIPEFSLKSDVWAFGCLIFEVFNNGLKPFHDLTKDIDILRSIKKVQMPKTPSLPKHFEELQNKIWVKNPTERPTFDQIAETILKTFPSFTWDDLQNCQINTIACVKRVRMPNLESLEEIDIDMPVSEKIERPPNSQGPRSRPKTSQESIESETGDVKSGDRRSKSHLAKRRVTIKSKYASTSGNKRKFK